MRSGSSGQALVGLLAVLAIALIIVNSVVSLTIVNVTSGLRAREGEAAAQAATAGLYHALLQLERNPAYRGETLTVGNFQVIIEIGGPVGSSPLLVTVLASNPQLALLGFERRLVSVSSDGVVGLQ